MPEKLVRLGCEDEEGEVVFLWSSQIPTQYLATIKIVPSAQQGND
jgi:hypothetical protein